MLTLLIVEDEDIARTGLRDYVLWKEYGIGKVLEARDGQEGLALLESEQVDMIITDVEMPLMDGITMVRKMRESGIDIPVIYLSGHWNLPYLKSAFTLDASDYLLKPVKFPELDERLAKVTGSIFHDIEQKNTLMDMKSKLEQSFPILIERFFHQLVHRAVGAAYNMEEKIRLLDIPIQEEDQFCLLTLSLMEGLDEADPLYLEKEMEVILARQWIEANYPSKRLYCMSDSNNRLSIAFIYKQEEEKNQHFIETFYKDMVQVLGEDVTLGLGKPVSDLRDLADSYEQSIYALEQSIFLGKNAVIYYSDVENTGQKMHINLDQDIRLLKEAVRTGKQVQVSRSLDEIFTKLLRTDQPDMGHIKNICMEILVVVNMQLMEYRLRNEAYQSPVSAWNKVQEFNQLEDLHRWMKQYLIEACHLVVDLQKNSRNNVVYYIVKAVENRYGEELSVPILAEELGLTPNYLYLLFKKERGETFNKYLTGYRMEMAKKILESPQYKLYEVAEAVGYGNPDYFTKVFKKHFGYSPSQFRER